MTLTYQESEIVDVSDEQPMICYPQGFDDRWEYEMLLKGYLSDLEVELSDGRRFLVNLIDPIRLAQDLEGEAAAGRPFFAEPGMIVLPEVTKANIATAIHSLWLDGFFEMIKPQAVRNGAIASTHPLPQTSIRT